MRVANETNFTFINVRFEKLKLKFRSVKMNTSSDVVRSRDQTAFQQALYIRHARVNPARHGTIFCELTL